MKILVVDVIRRWQKCLEERVVWQVLVVLPIVELKVVQTHLKCPAELDSYLLLFLEDELVVLHVLFSVGFEICADLMKVEAILVGAFLAVHEELAELTGPEGGSQHPIQQVVLVYCLKIIIIRDQCCYKYGDSTFSRVREGKVG